METVQGPELLLKVTSDCNINSWQWYTFSALSTVCLQVEETLHCLL